MVGSACKEDMFIKERYSTAEVLFTLKYVPLHQYADTLACIGHKSK